MTKKRKILTFAVVVVVFAAVVYGVVWLVGRLNRPKIPAGTLIAAYVDLDKAVDSFKDISKMAMKNLPDNIPEGRKEDIQASLDDLIALYKDEYRCYKADWACLTVTADPEYGLDAMPHVAIVVKCRYEAKGKSGLTLIDRLEEVWESQSTYTHRQKVRSGSRCAGESVLELTGSSRRYGYSWEEDGMKWTTPETEWYVAFVKGKYVIAAQDESHLGRMIRLYRDGKGEVSKAFDDLTDIGGDTIVRVQTCTAGDLLDFNKRIARRIEELAANAEDEDLVKEIRRAGKLTLDLKATDSTLGMALSVDAGCKDLARFLEGCLSLGQFGGRLVCDVLIAGEKDLDLLPDGMFSKADREGLELMYEGLPSAPEFFKKLRKSMSVERSGTVVRAGYELKTKDFFELLFKPFLERSCEVSRKFKKAGDRIIDYED